MKAILEYDLNDMDDSMSHLRAIKSLDMALVLWEIAYNVKKQMLYKIEEKGLDAHDAIEEIYKIFWEQINDRCINLDELIN